MMLPDFDKLPQEYKDYLAWHGKVFKPVKYDNYLYENVQFKKEK